MKRARRILGLLLCTALGTIAGCSAGAASHKQTGEQSPGLAGGVQYLIDRQGNDGAWRSEVYSPFKDGDALTPAVLCALATLPPEDRPQQAIERGLARLNTLVADDGSIKPARSGIAYPVYTAAGALIALGDRQDSASVAARQAWLQYLRERQLNEASGWTIAEEFYGGWGYDQGIPRKPSDGSPIGPLTEPNLSATVFALEGLRAAGVATDAPEIQQARRFVERCQNFAIDGSSKSPFDDGGFHFVLTDEVRNKAGAVGNDSDGRQRFVSYGSATADGLRALLLTGARPDDPRVRAAWQWLTRYFSAKVHPGAFPKSRFEERDSVYYYYCHSVARLLTTSEPDAALRTRWAAELTQELSKRQRTDGSWANPAVEVREDDPLVATPFAVAALAMCRRLHMVESGGSNSPADPINDRSQPANSPPRSPG